MRTEGEDVVFELAFWDDLRSGRGHLGEDGIDRLRHMVSRYMDYEKREHIRKMRSYKSRFWKNKERENWRMSHELWGSQDEIIESIVYALESVEFRIKMTPELKRRLEKLQKHNFVRDLQ